MLGLNETIDQLAMPRIMSWYVLVLKRKHGEVLRILECYVESERKKERSQRTLRKQVEEESMNIGLSWEDALC